MKRLTFWFLLTVLSCPLSAWAQWAPDQTVRGHSRQDGAFVQPYHRTVPDQDPYNNYSTRGNNNPWTGQSGTVNPERQSSDPFSIPASPSSRRLGR